MIDDSPARVRPKKIPVQMFCSEGVYHYQAGSHPVQIREGILT
jgi:hypothetical protein